VKVALSCDWEVTPKEAIAWQETNRHRVSLIDDRDWATLRTAAGIDVAYLKSTNRCYAGVVVIDVATNEILDQSTAVVESTFPYVPGLLTFREAPAVIEALSAIPAPDLLVFDGQGYAHPRRMGLASHMGLIYDRPSLGLAKSRLIGTHDEPGGNAGDASPLYDGEEQIGWELRSKANCKPIYVSPGHRISVERSLQVARMLLTRHRIPEITRRAHLLTQGLLPAEP
jgi:deoxyribonuclease V